MTTAIAITTTYRREDQPVGAGGAGARVTRRLTTSRNRWRGMIRIGVRPDLQARRAAVVLGTRGRIERHRDI